MKTMKTARALFWIWIAAFAVIAMATMFTARADDAPPPQATAESVNINIPGLGDLLLSGPYMHKSLAIYFVYRKHATSDDEQPYLLLDEGIKDNKVAISEDEQASVTRLVLTNASDKPLFLNVGELVRGGKQDRTLQTSLVVPPNTAKMPVPSFCVERSRWVGGKDFDAASTIAPSNGMRLSVQMRDQGAVWREVDDYKTTNSSNVGAMSGAAPQASKTSSVNEELDNENFKKLQKEYIESLDKVPAKSVPLGMVFAVNGQISTAEIYRSGPLFAKLYPKLLKGASAEAIAAPMMKPRDITWPKVQDVADFLAGAWDGKKQTETLGNENVYVRLIADKSVVGELFYKDDLIHVEVIKVQGPSKPAPPVEQPMQIPNPPPARRSQ